MSVYKSINAVQSDLATAGIAKDRVNSQGATYKFRGIDDIYNALAPLLAKHGLCIIPRMLSRHCDERLSQKGNALFYVTVHAEFDFVSSFDGSKHTASTFGEAMDSGDKATNKAMSAAYKYAAFQTFCIPTEGDNDADAHTHEVKTKIIPASPKTETLGLTDDEISHLTDMAQAIKETDAVSGVDLIEQAKLEEPQMIALWGMLDSKTRSAIKAEKEARKAKK
jgi:ERF superfamily